MWFIIPTATGIEGERESVCVYMYIYVCVDARGGEM
jgi:hypothetical protein